jgi:hypothetical protein
VPRPPHPGPPPRGGEEHTSRTVPPRRRCAPVAPVLADSPDRMKIDAAVEKSEQVDCAYRSDSPAPRASAALGESGRGIATTRAGLFTDWIGPPLGWSVARTDPAWAALRSGPNRISRRARPVSWRSGEISGTNPRGGRIIYYVGSTLSRREPVFPGCSGNLWLTPFPNSKTHGTNHETKRFADSMTGTRWTGWERSPSAGGSSRRWWRGN